MPEEVKAEVWMGRLVMGLAEATHDNAYALAKAYSEGWPFSTFAVFARNLVEISDWLHDFQTPGMARQFVEDTVGDVNEIIAIAEKQDGHSISDMQELRNAVRSLADQMNISGGNKPSRTNPNHRDRLTYKFLSKLMHPTAFAVIGCGLYSRQDPQIRLSAVILRDGIIATIDSVELLRKLKFKIECNLEAVGNPEHCVIGIQQSFGELKRRTPTVFWEHLLPDTLRQRLQDVIGVPVQ